MKNRIRKILVFVSRFILAVTFMFSGIVKAIDPVGSSLKFSEYFTALNLNFLQDHTLTLSIFLSSIEFTIGAALLWGTYRKLASIFAFIFLLIFTPLTYWLATTNAVSDCGCFGDAITLDNWETFYKNIFLLFFSIILIIDNNLIKPLFNYSIRWIPTFYSFLFATFFSVYAIYHLPILDFRPYKIGVNIKEEMGLNNENNKEYIFIYEKNGNSQEFDINNLPSEEDGWNFVETIVKDNNTQEPKIKDFFVTNENGEDVTMNILDNDSIAIYLLSYDLTKADDSNIDKIAELNEVSKELNIPFYIITSNDPEAIKYWEEYTTDNYNYLFSDIKIIETMIRSNPGIMILNKDKIIDKLNVSDLPHPENMESYIDNISTNKIEKIKPGIIILLAMLIYFIPILVLLLFNKTIELVLYKKDNNSNTNIK